MSEILFLIEEAPEWGFTARALGFSIYTEADTWEEYKHLSRMQFDVILKKTRSGVQGFVRRSVRYM